MKKLTETYYPSLTTAFYFWWFSRI